MFPAATVATFARNVVHRGILALFQFLLGLTTFSNGLSRPLAVCVTGRDGSQVVDSQRLKAARYGSAPDALRMPVRCLPCRHGLMGFLAFLTFYSRTDTSFTFCQDSLRMKRGHRTALERV